MDTSSSALLLQDFKPEEELELAPLSVDAGYFSASGSPSPSPSLEMSCISPPFGWWGHEPSHGPAAGAEPPALSRRRTGSKNPRKKRQTASEREKLRMRDLTKALHHLRTYLPASVAPAGQTLTKIETLRLAIRYISYLSSQLDVPEQPLGRRTEIQSPADLTGLSHYTLTHSDSVPTASQPDRPEVHGSLLHPCSCVNTTGYPLDWSCFPNAGISMNHNNCILLIY
uniref:Mesoderm posterior ab n=1 Tax=Electrophorus electricus TaxID=8005 RepID=A0A4W4GM16_ELEEL